MERSVVDLRLLARLAFHTMNPLRFIDSEGLHKTPDAVIGAGEPMIVFQVLMDALNAQARFIGLFDPISVRLTLTDRSLFPGVRVGTL